MVDREIEKLEDNPRHAGTRALWGEWEGSYRARAGVYRVIYVIDDPRDVTVIKVGGRGSVYGRD